MRSKLKVWRWKSNIQDYIGKPGVLDIRVMVPFKKDTSLQGRDGWVAFEAEPNLEKTYYEGKDNEGN